MAPPSTRDSLNSSFKQLTPEANAKKIYHFLHLARVATNRGCLESSSISELSQSKGFPRELFPFRHRMKASAMHVQMGHYMMRSTTGHKVQRHAPMAMMDLLWRFNPVIFPQWVPCHKQTTCKCKTQTCLSPALGLTWISIGLGYDIYWQCRR